MLLRNVLVAHHFRGLELPCLGACLDFTILSQSCCGDKAYLAFTYQNPGIDFHDLRTSASGQLSHYDSVPTYSWFEQIFEKAPRPNHKPYIHLSLIHEEACQSILILRMSSQLRVHDLLEFAAESGTCRRSVGIVPST
jgi:hypothetical protein